MDLKQRLVPNGVIGELVVIGDGLARGYILPQQNQDRFIHLSIGDRSVRAYRTGDYVRRRPVDGQLDFLGRLDHQVKIRGHRIELGDVDQVLRSNRTVDDAVTLVQDAGSDGGGDRLISFVTLRPDQACESRVIEQNNVDDIGEVKAWTEIRQTVIYADIGALGPQAVGRDFMGWNSMYDGQAIDRQEMEEWLQDTLSVILNGGEAGHVLEIGTGTDMVLFNLGDGLQHYTGLEPVETAARFVTETALSIPHLRDKVAIQHGTAADISALTGLHFPTMVVINSVVQYFTSPN